MGLARNDGPWPLTSKLGSFTSAGEELQMTVTGVKQDDEGKPSGREILRAVVFAHFDVVDGGARCGVGRSRRRDPGIDAKQ